MKKILLFILVFICLKSFGQFPVSQSLGTSKTQVYSKGAFGADSGFIYRNNFTDTTTANLGFLDGIPGMQIRTGSTLWLRNQTANAWVQQTGVGSTNTSIGSGIKIGVDGTNNVKSFLISNGLTGDSATAGQVGIQLGGSLTGNITLSGHNTRSITFDSVNAFTASRNGQTRISFNSGNTSIFNSTGLGGLVMSSGNTVLSASGGIDLIAPLTDIKGGTAVVGLRDSIYIRPVAGDLRIYPLNHNFSPALTVLTLDTTDNRVYRTPLSDIGGGSTPTLQQVLTAGSTLTTANTILSGANDFAISLAGVAARFYLGGSQTLIWTPDTDGGLTVNGGADLTTLFMGSNEVQLNPDSINIRPYLGRINIDSLRSGFIDTTNYKPLARKASGDIVQMNSWAQVSGGGGGSGWGLAGNAVADGNVFGATNARRVNVITNNTQRFFIDSVSASIGINLTTLPYLSAHGDIKVAVENGAIAQTYGGVLNSYWHPNGGNSQFVMRDGSGNNKVILNTASDSYFDGGGLGVGVTTLTAQLHTDGTVRFANFTAGTATFDASGNISSVSDGRLKNIIRPYRAGLKEINQLTPIVYKWKPESKMETVHEYAGFDARQINKVFGELGTGQNEQGYYSIQDRALIAAMVSAIQELSAKVDYLENELKKKK